MTNEERENAAARIEQRTTRILTTSGLMFLAWQAAYFVIFDRGDRPLRTVDLVTIAGYIAWACALLMLLATGGGMFTNKEVRAILDDELARSQSASAYRNGFWALIVVALAALIMAQVIDIPARVLAHVSLSAGVVVAVMTLAYVRRQ